MKNTPLTKVLNKINAILDHNEKHRESPALRRVRDFVFKEMEKDERLRLQEGGMDRITSVDGDNWIAVNACDFDRLNKYHWHVCEMCGHYIRVVREASGYRMIYLDSEISKNPEELAFLGCDPCPVPDVVWRARHRD